MQQMASQRRRTITGRSAGQARGRSRALLLLLGAGVLAAGCSGFQTLLRSGMHGSGPDPITRARAAFDRLPLTFEKNEGQTDPKVRFLARGRGYTFFLTPKEAVMRLNPPPRRGGEPGTGSARTQVPASRAAASPAVLRMRWLGANPHPVMAAAAPLPGKTHYFVGSDPTRWRADVPQCAKVRCSEIYPGIDLVHYGRQGQLEHDWVLRPGADPGLVRFSWEGAGRAELDPAGDLVLHTPAGEVRQQAPVAYQEIDGVRRDVPARFVLEPSASTRPEVRFALADYDRSLPLVIDPVLIYSTYIGGDGGDGALDIAVDDRGSAYITGFTDSTNFPRRQPFQRDQPGPDAFVTKLSPGGTDVIFSTFLGGDGMDQGLGIAVDPKRRVYVTGVTESTDFPTLRAMLPDQPGMDAFVTKLTSSGRALVYSTYLGGGETDHGLAIAVDPKGRAYVTGYTESQNFPIRNFIQTDQPGGDAFVTKLFSGGGSLPIYSTYLGGDGTDQGRGIAADANGRAYVTGFTASTDFPTRRAFQTDLPGGDAFVTKLFSGGGGVIYSTYLGGSGTDAGSAIAVDPKGRAYVTGSTDSIEFPTIRAFQADQPGGDAFVTKLFSSGGSALIYSTYLGGDGTDQGAAIVADDQGRAYVAGFTLSTDFPTRAAFQGDQPEGDAFVTKLFSSGGSALIYSTYLGGDGTDRALGIDLKPKSTERRAYVAGFTDSSDFPTRRPIQRDRPGTDAFVTKLSR